MISRRLGIGAAVVALAVAIGTGPAGADLVVDRTMVRTEGPDATVLDVVDSVAGTAPGIEADARSGSGTLDGASVTLPADGDDRLILEPDVGPAIELSLPAQGPASVEERGSVLDATSPEASVVARPSEDGVQALVVIDGPAAATRFRFGVTVEGARAVLRPSADGGVAIFGSNGEALGLVEPPWAIDADGTNVATHYEIEGSTLVQVVDHHDATYPVVADPAVRRSCGVITCTWYWSVAATKRLARSVLSPNGGLMSTATTAVACWALAVAGPASVACQALYVVGLYVFGRQLQQAVDRGGCFTVSSPPRGSFGSVGRSNRNCRNR